MGMGTPVDDLDKVIDDLDRIVEYMMCQDSSCISERAYSGYPPFADERLNTEVRLNSILSRLKGLDQFEKIMRQSQADLEGWQANRPKKMKNNPRQ